MLQTGPSSPADGRRADARRNILAIVGAAAEALAANPRASMQDIADACGLHRATVHRHFASRDDLLVAVRDHAFAEAAARRDAIFAEGDEPMQALARYVAAMLEIGDRYRLYRFMPIVDARNESARRSVAAPVADVIASGQERGVVRADLGAGELAMALAGLIATAQPEIALGRMTLEQGVALCTTLLGARSGGLSENLRHE